MYGPSSYIAARRTAPGNFGRHYPTSRNVGYKYVIGFADSPLTTNVVEFSQPTPDVVR